MDKYISILSFLYFLTLIALTLQAQDLLFELNDSIYPSYNQLSGNITVRLIPNYFCRESSRIAIGRVEVKLNGNWGTVCRNKLNFEEESVLCRQLGHNEPYRSHPYCSRGDRHSPLSISYMKCIGNESYFQQCFHESKRERFCQDYYGSFHGRDAALSCYKKVHQKPYKLPISLHLPEIKNISSGPISSCSGVVVISYNGADGYISKLGVNNITGTIICEQLGYYKYLGPLPDQYIDAANKTLPILMAKPNCTGSERRLMDCPHWGWGPFQHLVKYGPYSVQCACKPNFECGEPKENTIRLRSKSVPWKGRLEVKVDGEWGSVCSHEFSRMSVAVACRQLGFKGSGYYQTRDYRNGGYGKIKLRNVHCQGSEDKLTDCDHHKITPPDGYCRSHSNDIMLYCDVDIPEPQVRLKTHTSRYDSWFGGTCRLVEYRHGDQWYPHCCENDVRIDYALTTVCRETGSGFITKSGCSYVRHDIVNSTRGEFSCEKGACFTDRCKTGIWNVSDSCPSNQYTYVCCSQVMPDLVPDYDVLVRSIGMRVSRNVQEIPTKNIACAVEDGCLGPDANPSIYSNDLRRLLRFSTMSDNVGTDVFRPPVSPQDWIYHNCHQHYHSIEHFADYSLTSKYSTYKVYGHKASFCLEDTGCKIGGYSSRSCGRDRYGNQGISANCYDLYGSHLDCQWIDVTRTPAGTYYFTMDMNPSRLVPESDFSNNVIRCEIEFRVRYYFVESCEFVSISTPGHS